MFNNISVNTCYIKLKQTGMNGGGLKIPLNETDCNSYRISGEQRVWDRVGIFGVYFSEGLQNAA